MQKNKLLNMIGIIRSFYLIYGH